MSEGKGRQGHKPTVTVPRSQEKQQKGRAEQNRSKHGGKK